MYKVRIIKSEFCDECKKYLPLLDKMGFKYEIYDGDDKNNASELDSWHIFDFPVVQIIEEHEDGKKEVKHQFVAGKIIPRTIMKKINELSKK